MEDDGANEHAGQQEHLDAVLAGRPLPGQPLLLLGTFSTGLWFKARFPMLNFARGEKHE